MTRGIAPTSFHGMLHRIMLTGDETIGWLNHVPAPLWVEDWSIVSTRLDELRAAGVTDLRSELLINRDLLRQLISGVIVVALNEAAAGLADEGGPIVTLGPLPPGLLDLGVGAALLDQVMVVWEGRAGIECQVTGRSATGEPIDYQLDWKAPQNGERPDYSRVSVMTRNLRRHQQIRRHVSQLEALLEIGRTLASTFDSEAILRLLVDAAASLTHAEEGLIFLLDTDAETVTKTVSHQYPDSVAATVSYEELMDGMTGLVMRTRSPLRSDDIATDPRNSGSARVRAAGYPGTSAAIAPIIVNDEVVGTLTTLNNADAPTISNVDLSLVNLLASQAAVALRNAELYGDLRASQRELQDLIESKDRFIAAVSHELRTPLSSVVGFSELIEEQMDHEDPLRDMMGEVVDQGEQMAAIIDDLLVAARSSLGSVATAPELIDVAEVAGIVCGALGKRIGKPIRREIETAVAFADPTRVRQILRNLITNADRYGGESILVRVRVEDDHAVVQVCDDGRPLPAEARERIFLPYESSGSATGQPAAIGLGLSVSRALAELMGGSLSYDHDGEWSTFELRLPRNPVQEAASSADR